MTVALSITAVCWSQDAPLFYPQISSLDHMLALTRTRSQAGTTALELLELVALGRTSAVPPGAETQVGLPPGELQTPFFADPGVRQRAINNLGRCGMPEALEFLKNLKPADLSEDKSRIFWTTARVALKTSLLDRIEDPQAKTQFLMSTLAEEGDGRTSVAFWAGGQLCDRGGTAALPLIRRSLKNTWSGARGDEAAAYCEARMQVIARDPDRVRALGSVLTVDDGTATAELAQWAVSQLELMHTPQADAELDRFANELDRLPQGSPQRSRFWIARELVRDLRAKQPK